MQLNKMKKSYFLIKREDILALNMIIKDVLKKEDYFILMSHYLRNKEM